MRRTQFEQDAAALGFTIENGLINAKGTPTGQLAGATAEVERTVRKATFFAQMSTKLGERSQMHGKASLMVTVRCPDATLIVECHIKRELAARRFVDAVNRAGVVA